MARSPNWLRRFLLDVSLVGVHGDAFHPSPPAGRPSVWVWYLEWRLWRKFEYLARAARIPAEYYGAYSEDSPLGRENLDAGRRLMQISFQQRGWRGIRRRARFGPGSLAGTGWLAELQARCVVGAFVKFHCESCGTSGTDADTRLVDWESGEGAGRTWGQKRVCGTCDAEIASVPLRAVK